MMLYDIIMVTLITTSTVGAIWASRQMSKAAKEGKLRVIGKVRIDASKRNSRMDS